MVVLKLSITMPKIVGLNQTDCRKGPQKQLQCPTFALLVHHRILRPWLSLLRSPLGNHPFAKSETHGLPLASHTLYVYLPVSAKTKVNSRSGWSLGETVTHRYIFPNFLSCLFWKPSFST